MVARGAMRSRRGFTLIEVIVASGVGIIILAVIMGYLLQRSRNDQHEAQLGRLKQDASVLLGQLRQELGQAGLGRPSRARREGTGELFPGPLLAAEETSLSFVADLPRPDSSLHGLSSFAANQVSPPLPEGGVALLNELTGGCDVDSTQPSPCRTDEASLLLASSEVDCRDAPGSAPTCPWGLNKYRPGEWLVLVDGVGRWVERQVAPQLFANKAGRFALLLQAPLPGDFFSVPNRGWVASVDRVFYRLNGSTVERKQCWGPVGSPATVGSLSTPCTSLAQGTAWEPLLRTAAPKGFAFRYLDATGAELAPLPLSAADLRRVRRVEVALRLTASTSGKPVTYETLTAFTPRQ